MNGLQGRIAITPDAFGDFAALASAVIHDDRRMIERILTELHGDPCHMLVVLAAAVDSYCGVQSAIADDDDTLTTADVHAYLVTNMARELGQ